MSAVICYPQAFLERPEDRSLLVELAIAEVPEDSAKLILYRIWADFATSGSDRRVIDEERLDDDRQVRVLEAFCGWKGAPGRLVRLAAETGFLKIEGSENGTMLICKDFFPINSAWSSKGRSFQKKGAFTRVMRKHLEAAETDAVQREELWSRTGAAAFLDIPEASRKDALRFIYRICRALGIQVPSDEVLRAGPFRQAIDCQRDTPAKVIDDTLIWLISRRKSPDIPDRIDAILRAWPDYVKQAAAETA